MRFVVVIVLYMTNPATANPKRREKESL